MEAWGGTQAALVGRSFTPKKFPNPGPHTDSQMLPSLLHSEYRSKALRVRDRNALYSVVAREVTRALGRQVLGGGLSAGAVGPHVVDLLCLRCRPFQVVCPRWSSLICANRVTAVLRNAENARGAWADFSERSSP